MAMLTGMSLAPMSRWQVCEWRCWALTPRFRTTLYVDLGMSATVVGNIWRRLSSRTLLATVRTVWCVIGGSCCCSIFRSFGNSSTPYSAIFEGPFPLFWRSFGMRRPDLSPFPDQHFYLGGSFRRHWLFWCRGCSLYCWLLMDSRFLEVVWRGVLY